MNHSHDDAIEALLRQQFDGPVSDNGFCERVMQKLPPRRRIAWPLWTGILAGAGAAWLSLLSVPMLHAGWRDGLAGEWSATTVALLLVSGGMSLLASCWSLMEADDR